MTVCSLSLKVDFEDGRTSEDTSLLPSDLAIFILEKCDKENIPLSEIAVRFLSRGIISEIKEIREKFTEPLPSTVVKPPEIEPKQGEMENVK